MTSNKLNAQRFSRWSAAAAAGLSLMACNKSEAPSEKSEAAEVPAASADSKDGDEACCMGLNQCKGKGGCAVPESHDCQGKNECKGKGGCNMHCPK